MRQIYLNQPRMSKNVKLLLISFVSVFVIDKFLEVFLKISISGLLGFSPGLFFKHLFLWQIFTYLFLHADLFHLLFNGLVLYMIGSELEFKWGGKKFLRYFFITSMGGAVLQSLVWGFFELFLPDSPNEFTNAIIIGASGGLYGLFAAFGMLYGEARVYMFLLFPLKAKQFVLLLLGIEVISAVFFSNSGVAHLVHLGGLFAGYFMLKIQGPNLDGRGGGGFGGWKKTDYMSREEVRRRLNLVVNRDSPTDNKSKDSDKDGKFPITWN